MERREMNNKKKQTNYKKNIKSYKNVTKGVAINFKVV
jgi:hypothetical protein